MHIIDLKSSCKTPYTPPTKFSWKGVAHAFWSNRIFTSHGTFTNANISVLCNSVSERLQGKELHLPRSISMHGLRAAYFQRKPTRYRIVCFRCACVGQKNAGRCKSAAVSAPKSQNIGHGAGGHDDPASRPLNLVRRF